MWDLSTRRPCVTLSEAHPGGAIEAAIITDSAGGTPTSWLYTCAQRRLCTLASWGQTLILQICSSSCASWLPCRQGRDNSVCVWNLTELLAPTSSTSSAFSARPTPAVALPDSDHSFCKMAIGVPTTQGTPVSKAGEGVEPEPEPEPEPTADAKWRADVAPRLVGLASTTDSNMSIWDTYAPRYGHLLLHAYSQDSHQHHTSFLELTRSNFACVL
eukprot:COSAG02_NODE_6009_length_3878_cov_2.899974_3_plen_215_part_00